MPAQTFDKLWRFLNSNNRRQRLRDKLRHSRRFNRAASAIKTRLGLINPYLPHRQQQILQDLNKYRR